MSEKESNAWNMGSKRIAIVKTIINFLNLKAICCFIVAIMAALVQVELYNRVLN